MASGQRISTTTTSPRTVTVPPCQESPPPATPLPIQASRMSKNEEIYPLATRSANTSCRTFRPSCNTHSTINEARRCLDP
ncbi:hypothetical protein A1O7_02075 [Cladophialophora yegresii CBS 114405]|uniref:Uncharacterized protein n=1 Tax=Cladophialophora yegresii CBS 114405 TaxID=1182544 RepID=W9WAT3_9EURO|nr:uncharacterized protein A1O7_02075 [Cladophialophora yegresii CBS 114405]EXJ61646.1 hypothetical protein A1O7_02075 [Cladophialophora yegresii CBS 114405]